MKKTIYLLLISILLTSCDHFGSTRVKNLIDMTKKLEVESNEKIAFKDLKKSPFSGDKMKSHSISKSKVIGQPAIAKGVFYSVDTKGNLTAFSSKEKKILWSTNIAKNSSDRGFTSGGILFSDQILYVTYGSRNLVIIDANNGVELIRKEFPDILRSKPVLADDRLLLVQTISNQLVAYDTKSSKFLWINEGGLETISSANQISPVLYNDNVLVSYSSGEVALIDIKSGKEKWLINLTSLGEVGTPSLDVAIITTQPIVIDSSAFFAASNGKLLKINLNDGSIVWQKDAEDVQTMSIYGENLLLTNNARQLAIISANTGKVKWVGNLISVKERSTKKPKAVLFQTPFVSQVEDKVSLFVLASNGELYQFTQDTNGNLPQQPEIIKTTPGAHYQWLSCCSGKLHIFTDNKVFY